MAQKLVLGIDFGTLSARCVVVDVRSGMLAWSEHPYKHGVIESVIPGSQTALPPGAARQDPRDYIVSLKHCVSGALARSGASASDVVGIGIDFTSCTLLPITSDGTPLCWHPAYKDNVDAWVHLWKDQTAQSEANELTELARDRSESFLTWSGNKIAADTLYPKVWQIARRSPEVFRAADHFIEAGDWIVRYLTDEPVGGASAAGYKALWNGEYPVEFLDAVDADFGRSMREKLVSNLVNPGNRAGTLSHRTADELGLPPGIVVASPNIDAHAAVPGTGVTDPGTMVVVMGTSMCHMILSEETIPVPGIVGAVQDGIIPGYVGYEAGQPAVGDLFSWYVENSLPAGYEEAAKNQGVSPYRYLEQLGERLAPGESGLLALDWWNGNRSPLSNGNLSGVIVGYSLQTRPEHMFRALMESVAFGTYEIIRTFEREGVSVNDIRACGGVAVKSPMMLQLMADITGRPISLASTEHASALGAAIMAASAVQTGPAKERAARAIHTMTQPPVKRFEPNPDVKPVYDILYRQYRSLVQHFAKDDSSVMEALMQLKVAQAQGAAGLHDPATVAVE